MDKIIKRKQIPWNKNLKGDSRCLKAGKKMAKTRKKKGWFKDIEGFKKKRSIFMKSDRNPFLHKKQDKKTIIKIVNTRRKNGSYNHTKEWKKQHSIDISGENNCWWVHGKSGEAYGFNFTKELKTLIRKRDKFTCQICKKHGWIVHHIDYNKKNCNPNNLITLCNSCHPKTNYNRKDWLKYFKNYE